MCIGTGGARSTCSGTMNFNRFCSWEVYCFYNPLLLMSTSIIIVGTVKCKYLKAAKQGEETSKRKKFNTEREYWDCIKSRRDKIGIISMMHKVLYIVQLPNDEGDMHII